MNNPMTDTPVTDSARMDKPLPMQQAVALAYHAGDSAPRVVAKGRGALAQRIIEVAQSNQVFVHQSKELVALLMQVDLDANIPPSLYAAIAEILAWLYRIENGISTQQQMLEATRHLHADTDQAAGAV